MLNHNIPTIKAWVKRSFLTAGAESDTDGNLEEAYLIAIMSIKGHALYFTALLKSGALFRFVPQTAILLESTIPINEYSLEQLTLWDCFSNNPIVTVFDYLKYHECVVTLRDKTRVRGEYLFTVDWLPDNAIETGLLSQIDQNKCMHVIALENGQVATLPSNRVSFCDAYFIGNNPQPEKKGYKTVNNSFHGETSNKWSVAEDENFYYTAINDESYCTECHKFEVSCTENTTYTDNTLVLVKGNNPVNLHGIDVHECKNCGSKSPIIPKLSPLMSLAQVNPQTTDFYLVNSKWRLDKG